MHQLVFSVRRDLVCCQVEWPDSFCSGLSISHFSWELQCHVSLLCVQSRLWFVGKDGCYLLPRSVKVSVNGLTTQLLWTGFFDDSIHHSLLTASCFEFGSSRNHSIFTANSFLSIFLALFFFCSEFMLLCCTFSWLSSMLCIYYLTIYFLGSFLGTWAESRGRHVHMFWLWYVPFLWMSVDFIIMLCLCSWSTDASWNPGSNQSSLASLLGHFLWTGLLDLDAQ